MRLTLLNELAALATALRVNELMRRWDRATEITNEAANDPLAITS